MLEIIDKLTPDINNIIIYINSPTLQVIIKDILKEALSIERNHTISVSTTKDYKKVKEETMIPPFGGGLWFIDVDTEKIKINDIKSQIKLVSNASVTVYWTESYAMFKKLTNLEEVKQQGIYCRTFYFGRLPTEDIDYLHKRMIPEDKRLKKELLNYVKKNYTYDVQNVCNLFMRLKSGETVKSTKEIISLIGIGGNTIDSFVIKLLTSNPKTKQGLKKSFENNLKLLVDLNYTYDYIQIKRLMLYVIEGIIDMKQLQIMGLYSRVRKDIPETYSDKAVRRLNRLKRFELTILENINLARVLNLKMSLSNFNDFNAEISLIQGVLMYLTGVQESNVNNPESKEIKSRFRRWK